MTQFSLAIVGAKFRPPAAGLLSVLPQGFPLSVQREPTNAHDENAVMVLMHDVDAFSILDDRLVNEHLAGFGMGQEEVREMLRKGPVQLGYIPREDAKTLAPLLDHIGGSARAQFGFSASGLPRVKFTLFPPGGVSWPR
jgi:HIRAN domain